MNLTSKGLTAALVATLVLSAMMLIKSAMGVMPQLDIIAMLTSAASNGMGLPSMPVVGWIIHFFVGVVVYGVAFVMLNRQLPGHSQTVKGIFIGVIGWLMRMVVLMPMMGKGLFALDIGIMAPIMTLILHIIFGAVLGWTYAKLAAHSGHPVHA